jgi:hypothetical protein
MGSNEPLTVPSEATIAAPASKKAPISGGFVERMMGLEPTTFSMARRRSSQLSYIRERPQYSRAPAGLGCVERLVHKLVGQLVVLAAHGGVVDPAKPAG